MVFNDPSAAGAATPTAVDPGTSDMIVAGAGAVGLTLAIALARAGIATTLIGPMPPPRPGRTVALLDGSVRLLQSLDVWPALKALAAPLDAMRLVDATDSLFRPPPVTFRAREIDLPTFGFNVDNAVLETALRSAAAATPGLTLIDGMVDLVSSDPLRTTAHRADGAAHHASLLVAADGRGSRIRKRAGIGVRTRDWPQVALTALLTHTIDHGNVSTEFHTRQGPFTLVPLPASAEGGFRSSLVWVMRPDEAARRRALPVASLAAAIEEQSGLLLGRITIDSRVGAFPIGTSVALRTTGPRLALVGEAAHALPPIGAQGMNLSLRDVEVLAGHLAHAKARHEDLGGARVLDRFARERHADVALRTFGVDALNGSLLARGPIRDAVRGAGLNLLGHAGPVRRWIMRHGLAPEAHTR